METPIPVKFHGRSLITVAILIKRSMYPFALSVMKVLLKWMLCYAGTDFFVWPRLLTSGLHGSTNLSEIHLGTPAWAAIYT
jgi:hypothetical protein